MNAFAQTSHNYTINAVDSGNTYTLQYGVTPGAPTTFEGLAASTAAETLTISKNNAVVDTVSLNTYFTTSPFIALGYVDLGNGQYTIDSNQVALPANATVGQSGQIQTETTYTTSSLSTINDTATVSWALSADTATTAWLCANMVDVIVSPPSTISGSTCYKIDTSGNVSALKLAITVNGTTLNFQ